MARTKHPKYTGAIASARVEPSSTSNADVGLKAIPYAKGTLVYSKNAKHCGHLTGSRRLCSLESCGGERLGVRWDNGRLTFPCTEGMDFRKRSWRII